MKVHHVGYLVKKIEKALPEFVALGYELEQKPVFDALRKVDICFLTKDGVRVELVAPQDKNSATGELAKKIGNAPYHICYETEDILTEVEKLVQSGYMVVHEAQCAPAMANRRVVFLFNKNIGMIEIVEK